MTQLTGYATKAYATAQTQGMSQQRMLLQLYDFAVAGCVAGDARKTTAAIVELIAALNFDYEEIATGFYRLYEYALREVRQGHFEEARKVLDGLRAAWQQAFSRPAEPAAIAG
ncbi:MAG: flagellar protein FliS [Candidatus Rokubacteria bacterium]|nr:flagellar protein FliS [Candidatus Rokubacteria bacterium]